jgi:O-antigen ligase
VRPADGRRGLLLSLAAVAAIAALLALNLERIVTRLTTEQETVGAMWRGDRSGPPTTSLGLRWQAQAFGLARGLERPFLGWGAGTSSRLIEQSEDPGLREEGQALRHLHNAYLELLVQFGVAGTALAGVFLARLVGGLWRAARARRCPADYGAFLLAAFAFMLIWSLWSYRAGHQDWRVYWVLLAGTSLGFLVSPGRAPREAPQPSAADGRGPSSPAARGTDP